MAVVQTINSYYELEQAMGERASAYSNQALEVIYDYLWELSEDTGEDYQVDAVAINGEFSEYSSMEEFLSDFGYEDAEEAEYDGVMTVELAMGGILVIGQ